MKRAILFLVMLAAMASVSGQSDITRLRTLYQRTWRAMIEKDTTLLKSMSDSHFVLIKPNGQRQQRGALFADLTEGRTNYFHEAPVEEVGVRLTGVGSAELEVRTDIEANLGDSGLKRHYMKLHLWAERHNGTWVFTRCKVVPAK